MTIEKATSDDDLILTEITKKSKAYWKYSEEQIEKWTNTLTVSKDYIAQNETYKLILDNHKIAGYYSFLKKENQIIKLDNMFVAPEYIGNGYGKILMNNFIEKVKQTGFEKIVLDAEPNAEMFYQKFGFNVVGQFESSIKDRFISIMEMRLKKED